MSAQLTFWYKIPSIESCCDRARVIIQAIDQNEVWSSSAQVTDWTQVTIDLSLYVHSSPNLIFQFDSDYSVNYVGWYLDDIVVSGVTVPSNDTCQGAFVLTDNTPHTMDTAGATSTDGFVPSCQPNFGKGVWFLYTPPANGSVEVSTCGSSLDTVLQVYTGRDCRLLSGVGEGCNDDNGSLCSGTPTSRRTIPTRSCSRRRSRATSPTSRSPADWAEAMS